MSTSLYTYICQSCIDAIYSPNHARKTAKHEYYNITSMFINSGIQTFREPFTALSRSFATAAKTHIHICRCHSDTKSLAWALERLPYINIYMCVIMYIYIYMCVCNFIYMCNYIYIPKGSMSKLCLDASSCLNFVLTGDHMYIRLPIHPCPLRFWPLLLRSQVSKGWCRQGSSIRTPTHTITSFSSQIWVANYEP